MNEIKYIFGVSGIFLLVTAFICFSIVIFGETTHARSLAFSMSFITSIIGSIFLIVSNNK